MTIQASSIGNAGFDHLLSGYRQLDGVADELLDSQGNVRPVWLPFLNGIGAMKSDELAHAMARGNQYLRDAGVFFRHYGPDANAVREWPLSYVPLIVDSKDWTAICDGLKERADLLEAVMADIYGQNLLVKEGVLPAELLAANPEWLRPMVGVKPRSGHFLHFVAFDIGRGPDGNWWVLGDRTQAPSGAGFALETRMAAARSYSSILSGMNVTRLAGFFRQFRDSLIGLRDSDSNRVAILTPGPLNDTYFEHAYIARYLGFTLAQGEDLLVQKGKLMLRTVSGLKPLSVLWRRVDSNWCDPLELEASSRLGTPGLLGAMRSGELTMVNAPGSGALEIRALLAFIPRIAAHLNGGPLKLPNIATWWCGQESARDYVKSNLSRMTLDNAMSTRLPFEHSERAVIAGRTTSGAPVNPDWIDEFGLELAGQEIVTLSTAPAFDGDRIVPRPMSLRVFLARTESGWTVMPGGFARIGNSGVSANIAMQRGGSVCDVWVVSEDEAAPAETLLRSPNDNFRRTELGSLPSRAADNLFWLGRYVERTEQKVRLLRAWHLRLAENGSTDMPLMKQFSGFLEALGLEVEDEILPAGIVADIDAAIASAGRVRDRFSTDGWNALLDLRRTAGDFSERVESGDDAARAMSVLLRKISGFSGLVHENMYRFTGWRFLSIGRAIERAIGTAYFLSVFTDKSAPEGSLDLTIEAGDSIMTHRRLYSVSTTRETVIDLLLLDELNPRSVLHQIRLIREHLEYLPPRESGGSMTPLMRKVLQMETELTTSAANEFNSDELGALRMSAASLSGSLSESYLR
jgi:uncharacterized circularly permuted ATP-grasp superfamily protein/uncharacterized alpha-E superfamily protein